jgi:hypothetical protein
MIRLGTDRGRHRLGGLLVAIAFAGVALSVLAPQLHLGLTHDFVLYRLLGVNRFELLVIALAIAIYGLTFWVEWAPPVARSRTTGLLAIYAACCVGLVAALYILGWDGTWARLGVSPMWPPFGDMRTVQGGLDSVQQGLNPQVSNPGDHWHRVMNYPSLWLDIARILDLRNETHYLVLETAVVLAYVACCFLLLRRHASFWILVLVFSGSSVLAVERGNNDLVVFALLYWAVNAAWWLAGGIFLAAVALKIYPVFAIACWIKDRWFALVLGALALAVLAAMSTELRLIAGAVPSSATLSYGAVSVALAVEQEFGVHLAAWAIALILLTAALGLILAAGRTAWLAVDCESEPFARLFLAGASIYVGTFLLASNYDYRLVFLIFCVPYIDSLRSPAIRNGLLTAMIIASNEDRAVSAIGNVARLFTVGAKILVFVGLVVLIWNEVRRWLPGYFAWIGAMIGRPAPAKSSE